MSEKKELKKEDEEVEVKVKEEKIYIVAYRFMDLQDENKIYKPGDKFNIEDKSEERIKELSTKENRVGKILIKEQK